MSDTILIDARGLSCPTLVVHAKKALKEHSRFEILVNTEVAKENVRRYCEKEKATVEVTEMNDEWKLTVIK